MQQRNIIIFIIALLIASSFWLFCQSDRQTDPNLGHGWWTLAFAEPKSDNLNFTITNYSSQTNFHWQEIENSQTIKQGDVEIKKGASMDVSAPKASASGRVDIQVNSGNSKEDIYKNL